MEVENKPQPMAGFAVGILSPGKRTDQVCLPSLLSWKKKLFLNHNPVNILFPGEEETRAGTSPKREDPQA